MSESTIGIDVSKKDLTVALLKNGKSYKRTFDNNKSGFQKLHLWIVKQEAKKSKICLESTGSYSLLISKYLYFCDYEVYVANPLAVSSFAKSKLSRNKTDESDAVLIAEYIKVMPSVTKYEPASNIIHKLKCASRCLDDLKLQKQQASNHLESADILPKEIVVIWNNLIKNMNSEIRKLEKLIEQLITEDTELSGHFENLQTIPGIGSTTAISILAEIPDIKNFRNARQLAAFAGLTPKQHKSGTSISCQSKLSKIGSKHLRKALYFPAIVAKQHNPIIKAFCNRLEKKGKKPMVIIGAAMRKLTHIVFAILKNKVPFDPLLNT